MSDGFEKGGASPLGLEQLARTPQPAAAAAPQFAMVLLSGKPVSTAVPEWSPSTSSSQVLAAASAATTTGALATAVSPPFAPSEAVASPIAPAKSMVREWTPAAVGATDPSAAVPAATSKPSLQEWKARTAVSAVTEWKPASQWSQVAPTSIREWKATGHSPATIGEWGGTAPGVREWRPSSYAPSAVREWAPVGMPQPPTSGKSGSKPCSDDCQGGAADAKKPCGAGVAGVARREWPDGTPVTQSGDVAWRGPGGDVAWRGPQGDSHEVFRNPLRLPDRGGSIPGGDARPIAPAVQDRVLGTFNPAPVMIAVRTRVRGAWVYPANRVAVAFLTYDGMRATILLRSIGTERGTSTFGEPVGDPQPVAYMSASVKGFAASSLRNADRSVDAVYAYVNPVGVDGGGLPALSFGERSDGSVNVFSVRGRDGQVERVDTVYGGGPVGLPFPLLQPNRIRLADIMPAVCAGNGPAADGRPSQVLMAFVETETTAAGATVDARIRVGFLTRNPLGWRFETTALLPTAIILPGAHDPHHVPSFEMGLAFDVNRRKWMLGWYGPNNQLLLAAIRFDGTVAVGPTSVEYLGDAPGMHSGVMISYNKQTDRYLIQTDHDVLWARYDARSNTVFCLGTDGQTPARAGACGGPGVNDTADLIGGRPGENLSIATGEVWASGVDYSIGYEFREGGQYRIPSNSSTPIIAGVACDPSGGCPPGDHCRALAGDRRCLTPDGLPSLPGISARSREGTNDWEIEAFLWRTPTPGSLHHYVRVPREELTVALFRTALYPGSVGYTFIDETSDVDFDDVPLRT